jgi:death-on-curing family protein
MPKHLEDSQAHDFKWIDIEDFEYLCFDLAKELLSFSEPIPNFDSADRGLLESALGNPQQGIKGELLYPTIPKQGAILFYSLIKNHPFKNGNKRIAVMSLLVYIAINGMWINISPAKLYDLACEVSKSSPKNRMTIMEYIETMISEYLSSL